MTPIPPKSTNPNTSPQTIYSSDLPERLIRGELSAEELFEGEAQPLVMGILANKNADVSALAVIFKSAFDNYCQDGLNDRIQTITGQGIPIYIPAQLHTSLEEVGIELQQNSDETIRMTMHIQVTQQPERAKSIADTLLQFSIPSKVSSLISQYDAHFQFGPRNRALIKLVLSRDDENAELLIEEAEEQGETAYIDNVTKEIQSEKEAAMQRMVFNSLHLDED